MPAEQAFYSNSTLFKVKRKANIISPVQTNPINSIGSQQLLKSNEATIVKTHHPFIKQGVCFFLNLLKKGDSDFLHKKGGVGKIPGLI